MSLNNLSRAALEQCRPALIEEREEAVLVQCLDDYAVWALKSDESVTPSLRDYGFWEAWITSWFTHHIEEGDFVVDVGANCGYFTMLFERLAGDTGRVVAYECNPVYVGLLCATKDYNRANFVIEPLAVSDVPGITTLTYPGKYTGSASIVGTPFDPKWGEEHSVPVACTTLDEEFNGMDSPTLIKVDAESAEELIWNGASELLDRHDAPVMVLEYSPTDTYSYEFPYRLFEYGEVTRIGHDGNEYPINVEYLQNLQDWDMIVVRKK